MFRPPSIALTSRPDALSLLPEKATRDLQPSRPYSFRPSSSQYLVPARSALSIRPFSVI